MTKEPNELQDVVDAGRIPDPVDGQGEFDVEGAVKQFDLTQAARKESLDKIKEVLEQAMSAKKLDSAATIKCLRGMYVVTAMQDAIIVSLMGDLVRAIRSMAKGEVDVFNLTAKLFTITQALYDKQVVNVDNLEKIHKEITIPTLVAKLRSDEKEAMND